MNSRHRNLLYPHSNLPYHNTEVQKCRFPRLFIVTNLFLLLSSLKSSFSCSSADLDPADFRALLDFRKNVHDPSLYLADWKENSTLFNVICVTVSPNVSRVISVELQTLGLTGRLPPSVGNLTALRKLDLSNNYFYGPIPDTWASLTSLQELVLGGQNLNGSLEILSNFTNLKRLELSTNDFEGDLDKLPLENSTNLEQLLLFANAFTGTFPMWVKYLPNLRDIQLNECENLSPSELPSDAIYWPKNLTTVSFRDMNLVGEIPPALAGLTSLTDLDLSRNRLTGGIPKEFGSLNYTAGVFLDLSTNNLTGEIPPELPYGSWNRLSLYSNQLSGNISDFLRNICNNNTNSKALVLLSLQSNEFVGEIPREISNCKNLNTLELSSNYISGSLPATLSLMENLFSLSVEDNQISGEIPKEFENFQNLSTLIIHTNNISGPIPNFNSSNLNHFWAFSNNLIGSLPKSLRYCTNLLGLQLQNNQLSGEISILNNLPILENLNLTSNRFSGNIPYIKNWSSLTKLDLSNNSFNGTIPPSLGENAKLLTDIDLSNNFLTNGIPLSLLSPPNLLNLDISYNNLTQFFDSFDLMSSSLTSLQLQFNQISSPLPLSTLSNLPNLMFLNLENNQFFGPLPSNFSSYTRIKEIQFSTNNFSGGIPEGLYFIKSLTTLNVSKNQLNESVPALPTSLSIIDLSDNALSSLLPSFNNFDFLEFLDLSKNKLYGPIPPNLALLGELNYLDLSQNLFNGTIPSTFEESQTLKYFNVSNNLLDGPIPQNLSLFPLSSFQNNTNLCGSPLSSPCESTKDDHTKQSDGSKIAIIVVCAISVLGIIIIVFFALCCCCFLHSKNDAELDLGLGPGVGLDLGLEIVQISGSERIIISSDKSSKLSDPYRFGIGPRSGSERPSRPSDTVNSVDNVGFGRSISERSGLQSGAVLRKWCEAQAAKGEYPSFPRRESRRERERERETSVIEELKGESERDEREERKEREEKPERSDVTYLNDGIEEVAVNVLPRITIGR